MRGGVAAAVLLAGAMALTGCGSGMQAEESQSTATSTTRLLEEAPAPAPESPDGVAVAAIAEIYTWEPATEQPGDSLERARKWLGPSMIGVLDEPAGDVAVPGPSLQWADWAREEAGVEAFTFAAGEQPPPGPDPDTRQYKIGVEQTAVYPDGRRDPLEPATVIATVVRTPDGWRLDGYR